MSEAAKAIATLRDYVERSTHWRAGGATRHDALKVALPELEDNIEWTEKGLAEWRYMAQVNARHAKVARATAHIAIGHLQALMKEIAPVGQSANASAARDWLTSIGSEPK